LDLTTKEKLEIYIEAEMKDAALYKELAKIAPNGNFYHLLIEFSNDEQAHADEFKRIYRRLTGKNYNPVITPPILEGSFDDILRDRVIDESGDYRKYAQQYIQTERDDQLKKAYYRAKTDENVHALRLLYMLSYT
jgi:rubrerythrin